MRLKHLGRKLAMPALVIFGLCFGAYFVSVVGAGEEERTMHQLVNAARDARGHTHLRVTDFLKGYAEDRARVLANRRSVLPHDPCGGCGEVTGSTYRGAWVLLAAWLRSASHFSVLMDPHVDRLGCGMVTRNGVHWWACETR